MSLSTQDYDYPLPPELIASRPLSRRDDSRMMVLHRGASRIEHRMFREFPGLLQPEELVVLNDTRVIPARVHSTDGRIELLFLEQTGERAWKCMVRPGRRMRPGEMVLIEGNAGRVEEVLPEGERVILFEHPVDLDRIGKLPLPPYLRREVDEMDLTRYQTVYAGSPGAVAAPTAGLHFTQEILAAIPHVFLTLHVGAGTFRPVKAELLTEHRMQTERFRVSAEAAGRINAAKHILAVGTTTLRVLESIAEPDGQVRAGEGSTGIFIHPPFEFRAADRLLTNFHLPKSTLLMLVSAFAGREFVMEAYEEAIREKYRFYSYGDCMLISP